jgi:hypothetical protein
VIANTALVKGDLRYLSDEQRDRARAKMRAIVANNLPGTGAEIAFRVSYPPMSPTPGNLRLLEQYSQVSDDAGLGPIQAIAPGLRGAGDVQFVAPYDRQPGRPGRGGRRRAFAGREPRHHVDRAGDGAHGADDLPADALRNVAHD